MAPINKMRTYGRSAKSFVNNSVDAGRLLFQNKITKRRKKRKLVIKELPARTAAEELFHQDSFQVSTEDTFDKLAKGGIFNPVNIKSQISIVQSSDTDISSSIKRVNSIHSPIFTKRKKPSASITDITNNVSSDGKKHEKDTSKIVKKANYFTPVKTRSKTRSALTIDTSNSSDSVSVSNRSDVIIPRFNEPSGERIDFSLEVEKVRKALPKSLSYIVVPKLKENDLSISGNEKNYSKTKDLSFEPIFTKTFREKQLIHSSTPLAPMKTRKIVNYTISPIKNLSRLENSVNVEQSVNFDKSKSSFLKSSANIEQDSKLEEDPRVELTDSIRRETKEKSETKKVLRSFQNINDKENFNVIRSPVLPTVRSNLIRESFITLRRRKILKTPLNRSRKKSNKTKIEEPTNCTQNTTEELSDFSAKTNSENTSESSSNVTESVKAPKKKSVNLSDFKDSFCERFVNKRRRRLTDSILVTPRRNKTSNTTGKASRRFSYQNSIPERPTVELRDLIVLLPKVNSSISRRESETHNSDTVNRYNSSESDVSTTTSSQVSENDFFHLKHPVFVDFAVNLTRLPIVEQFKSNTVNSVVEFHSDTSRSLFESYTVGNKSDKLQRQDLPSDCVSVNSSLQDVCVVDDSKESVESDDEFEIVTNRSKKSTLNKKKLSSVPKSFPNSPVDKIDFDKELVVNVTRSPWRKDKRSTRMSKTVTESSIIDLMNVSEESVVRKSNAVSNISALRQSGAEEFKNNDVSDIIETSVSDDIFRVPVVSNVRRQHSKSLMLKPGKLWRRSLSMYKRSSIVLDVLNQDICRLANGSFCMCPKCNLARQINSLSTRRNSIRIVPITPARNSHRKISILENYAHNASYVSDRILEDNLEDDLRSLSLSKGKESAVPVQDPQPVTARDLVLKKCGQEEPLPFEECYPVSLLQHCQKIGEGVYGEVFLFRNPNGGTSVIKIIPIEGDQIVNGERQKKFDEILSEITIALELSNLRNKKQNVTDGFSEVQKVCCVQGRYPEKLLELWDLYDENRNSENDSPDIFGDEQLYIVLQLANGGMDLEAFVFNNSVQAYAMFQQVACSLAVAEEELHFEHRDLHWGNVLLSLTDKNTNVVFRLDGHNYEIPTKGVKAAIIDFTLSRIECDGVVIFNDLGLDPDLFTAEGDYQFEVYKLMQKKNGNNWQRFEPHTNVLWLHYVLDKAVTALRYRNAQTKIHKEFLCKLVQLKGEILAYGSAKEFVSENF